MIQLAPHSEINILKLCFSKEPKTQAEFFILFACGTNGVYNSLKMFQAKVLRGKKHSILLCAYTSCTNGNFLPVVAVPQPCF